jgi:hypothetical protein
MFALDLFNTRYEKELNEGAVDNLTARLLEPLSQRAADIRTKLRSGNISPAEMKALEQEYANLVAKRVDIIRGRAPNPEFQKHAYKKNEFDITEPKDECMGYGSLGETDDVPVGRMQPGSPEYAAARNRSVKYAGLPDVADKASKMTRLNQPGKVGSDIVTPQQRVNPNPNKGIVGHAKDWLTGKGGPGKEGPTYEAKLSEEDEEQAQQELGAGYGVYQALLNAWNDKKPYVVVPMPGGQNLSITRNQIFNVLYALKNMNDNSFKKTIATAFSNLDKFMVWSNSIKRYQLPAEKPPQSAPGQMKLFKEAGQKKNSEESNLDNIEAGDTRVQRELQKIRARHPAARSDIEALAKDEIVNQEKTNKNINDLEAINARQDAALKQARSLDAQQDNDIDGVEKQLGQLSQRLQLIKTAKPATGQTASNAPKATKSATIGTVPQDAPQTVFIANPETLPQKDQKIYAQVKNLETELKSKIDAMATWNKVAQQDDESRNELEMLRKDMERTKREINRKIKDLQKSGIKVQQAPQSQDTLDLGTPASKNYISNIKNTLGQNLGDFNVKELPTASNADIDTDNILSQKQIDQMGNLERQPKQSAEVEESAMSEIDVARQDLEQMSDQQFLRAYKMSKAKFVQTYRTLLKPAAQQDVPLDESQRLHRGDPIVVTGPNEFEGATGEIYEFSPSGTFIIVDLYNHGKHSMHLSDVEYNQYADEEEVDEGFQDFNKVEPYAVCLAGKPVKQFDYYEDARRFHDNWKKKLYREGNKEKADKITLMPIMDEGWKSALAGAALAGATALGSPAAHSAPVQAGALQQALSQQLKKPALPQPQIPKEKEKSDDSKEKTTVSQTEVKEAGSPAQQAAIAIAMKKAGKKPKQVDEDTGSWIVYDPETKQIKKRFKTHTAGKSYARAHGLGFASSEYYFDNIKQGVAENDDYDDGEWEDIPDTHAMVKAKQPTRYPEQVLRAIERNPGMRADIIRDYERKQGVAEGQTDYQKRRQRERDVDAGRPVKALPKNPQTDYARKRAKDKRDMELGEDSSTSSDAVERAIIHRIMVDDKLRNMAMDIGTDKVFQAVEEVAYNVGDVDEIGSSDVSGWVNQVKQILGV